MIRTDSPLSARTRTGLLGAALVVAVLLAPAPATAADGDGFFRNCIGAAAGCTPEPLLDGAYMSALSPDGKHLYVSVIAGDSNRRGNGIVQLDYDAAARTLTRHAGVNGCVTSNGSPSNTADISTRRCQLGRALGTDAPETGRGIAISPDGTTVYYTSHVGMAIFTRNTTTGELTQKDSAAGCVKDDTSEGCTDGPYFTRPSAMAIDSSGSSLYVRVANGVIGFKRNADGTFDSDPLTRTCVNEAAAASCVDGAGLSTNAYYDDTVNYFNIRQMALSPDGKNLYVASRHNNYSCWYSCYGNLNYGVAVLNRNTSNGALTQTAGTAGGCITNSGYSGDTTAAKECLDGPDQLNSIEAVAIDPTGNHVYVSGSTGIHVFRRNAADGLLLGTAATSNGTAASCILETPGTTGCADGNAVGAAANIEFAPDGRDVIVGSAGYEGVSFLRRDVTTGALTQRAGSKGCLLKTSAGGCEAVPQLDNYATARLSPNGLVLFATGSEGDTVSVLDRDFAPTCQAKSAAIPHNASAAVPLSCSDVNGDALTLEITRAPTNGILAAIDQAASTVRYNPFTAFGGADSFAYRAVGRDVGSAPAEVSLTVAAPPPPPPPPPSLDADGDGSPVPQDCNDTNPGIRPGATDVPNNGVDEDCASGDAIARIATGVTHAWRAFAKYTTVSSLAAKPVPAGTTIELLCKGGGCPFASKRLNFTKATASVNLEKVINPSKKKKGAKKARKKVARLRVGTTLTVRITAPGLIGRVVTFKMRARKIPSVSTLCLPPGVAAPVSC